MEMLHYKFQLSDKQEKDNRYDYNNEHKKYTQVGFSWKFGRKETMADI